MTMLVGLPADASALTVIKQTPTSCDAHSALTDWNRTLSLPQFAVPGGTLTAVTVSQEVSVRSDYRVESRNGAARTDTLTLDGATVRVEVPGLTPTAAQLSAGTRSYSLTAFDGTIDYSGSSGATGSFGVAGDSSIQTPAQQSAWIGSGLVYATATSSASTNSTLSGNYRLEWDTTSDVKVCVTYTYTENVLVCIGDYVWHDVNKNGIQEAGEASVPDRPVSVMSPAGVVLGMATTDANGLWKVCNLEPSQSCVVNVDLPDGWTLTSAFQGPDRAVDSDGRPAGTDATLSCVTPPSGEDLTFDVGIYKSEVPEEPDAAPAPPATRPPAAPRIAMTKQANRNAILSRGMVTFTVRVVNRGGQPVRNLRVCDTPPAQLAFSSRPRGATVRNGQLCWSAARLLPGRSMTYRYTMRATNVASMQCVVNRVTATSGTGGAASARDNVCIRATRLGVLQLAG